MVLRWDAEHGGWDGGAAAEADEEAVERGMHVVTCERGERTR